MFWWKRHKQTILILFLLLILTIPVILPLLHGGFFQSDDGEWMAIRFSAFHQAFADGQFPVRWLSRLNQEYGYPVSNFLYPGFMYLAEIPKFIGFNFVNSIKIIMGFSLIFSAVFSYLWLNKLFSKLSSLAGAIFYLYMPYHLFDVYKRGSVGEILALAVVPFILWMVEKKNWFFYSCGIGLLILSHNTLAILFLPVIVIYVFLRKILSTYYFLLSTLLGFGLSTFFWLPALYDLQYTHFYETTVSNWQSYFVNINLIGYATLAIILLNFIILRRFDDTNHQSKKLFRLFFLLGLGSIFLATSFSTSVWQYLPVSFIQFPFRLLSITILCGAFLTAFITEKIDKLKIPLTLILIVIIFFSAKPYLQPTTFFDKGEGFYATNEGTTTVQNEYMPKWVQEIPNVKPGEKVEVITGQPKIEIIKNNNHELVFNTSSTSSSQIKINTLYFSGWQIWVDKQETMIDYRNPEGLMRFNVKPGSHQIMIKFSETPVRLLADCITIISFIIVIILIIKTKKKK